MRFPTTAQIHAALRAAVQRAVLVCHSTWHRFAPKIKEQLIVDRPLRTMGILLAIFAVATIIALGAAWIRNQGDIGIVLQKPEQEEIQEIVYRRAIDGVRIDHDEEPTRYVALTVDNIQDALPQSGVATAPLVYEAPVEGGLTRLLLIYPQTMGDIPKIGPVRSVRPYFIDWAKEFNALIAHVGGSPEALQKLSGSPLDLDEFRYSTIFWRDTGRRMPHNTFTSSMLLAKAFEKLPGEPKELPSWLYKDEVELTDRPEKGEDIHLYAKLPYSWRYDRETNAYVRYNGKQQKDADGKSLIAKNIVVVKTDVQIIDEVGRRKIKTVGQGDVVIYRDGTSIKGTWQKESAAGRMEFLDEDGKQIALNAGTTWITIIPSE